MKKKMYTSFIMIMIVSLSFLLRIYRAGDKSIWLDEGFSVSNSKNPILTIMTSPDPHSLYFLILHFWTKLFGYSELSIRFPSIIFGVLSVYVIFKLGEVIFDNESIGILSAFIVSISRYHIQYSQDARPYSLLFLFVLLSNYYFIKILKEMKGEQNVNKRRYTGYTISSIMTIFSQATGLFYIISQNIYYLLFQRPNIKSWIKGQFIILSIFLLWILYIISPFITMNIENASNNTNIFPTANFIYGTFELFLGNDYILYIFVSVMVMGLIIRAYNKEDMKIFYFMILWLFLPFIFGFMTFYFMKKPMGYMYSRYFIATFPVLILLFSNGIFSIASLNFGGRKHIDKIAKISVISIILIITMFQIPLTEGYYQNMGREQWKDVANYIKENKEDSDTILLYPNFLEIPFSYYYNGTGSMGIDDATDIKNIEKNQEVIWLVFSHLQYDGRKKESILIENELSEMYIKKNTIKFTNIDVYLYSKRKV